MGFLFWFLTGLITPAVINLYDYHIEKKDISIDIEDIIITIIFGVLGFISIIFLIGFIIVRIYPRYKNKKLFSFERKEKENKTIL